MALIRSWNLFHGNSVPPERDNELAGMVRLAVADRPDVLCLQELPVWALERLAGWTGMTHVGDVAQPPRIGPLPSSARVGQALTSLHPGLLRSAFSGQANAVLLGPGLRLLRRALVVLNDAPFRHAQARRLRLPLLARLAWAAERRIAQVVRCALPDGRMLTVANLHATYYRPDERLADAELLRAAVFADAAAEPGDICVVAGDLNARAGRSRTLEELQAWGFSPPGPGIDHVLVRGADAGAVEAWPRERRLLAGRVLSDHAPVEVRLS